MKNLLFILFVAALTSCGRTEQVVYVVDRYSICNVDGVGVESPIDEIHKDTFYSDLRAEIATKGFFVGDCYFSGHVRAAIKYGRK